MNGIKLMTFGETCLFGSVLTAAVILLRLLLVKRLPKNMFKALWLIAVFRFLLPLSVPSAFSVYSLVGANAKPAQAAPVFTIVSTDGSYVSADLPPTVPVKAVIWLIGAAVTAAWFTAGYLKCRKEFNMSIPVDDERIASLLSGCKKGKQIQIRVLDKIKSPVSYGIIRPVILLPKFYDKLDDIKLKHIILHELTHIKRFDGLFKLLTALAVCVYWFNPLIWLMLIMSNRDIELSCDEAVINRLGIDSGGDYAMTLLSMEERRKIIPLFLEFSRYSTKERIESIMKMNKKTLAGGIIAALTVTAVVLTLTTSADEPDIESKVTSDETVGYTEVITSEITGNESGLTDFDGLYGYLTEVIENENSVESAGIFTDGEFVTVTVMFYGDVVSGNYEEVLKKLKKEGLLVADYSYDGGAVTVTYVPADNVRVNVEDDFIELFLNELQDALESAGD